MFTLLLLAALQSDPTLGIALQRNFIENQIAQGKTVEQVCEASQDYFEMSCAAQDGSYTLTKGGGTEITYTITINTKP